MGASKKPDKFIDKQIESAVSTAFLWNWLMSNENISIAVKDGWVILEGELEYQYQIRTAESLVSTVKGVKGVISRLRLSGHKI
jgi:osmotically-inducible protein OsmY